MTATGHPLLWFVKMESKPGSGPSRRRYAMPEQQRLRAPGQGGLVPEQALGWAGVCESGG